MQKRVAIQGIKGSFHDLVVQRYFKNENFQLIECMSFESVSTTLKDGDADIAIMAIENTLAGSILPNYTHIQENNFFIGGEIYLHIQMNLLALRGNVISDLKRVASHPMALRQCREYFKKYSKIELVEINDTADGARKVSEEQLKDVGIIASKRAADLYGLDVLSEGIETHKENYTRFLVLTRDRIEVSNANKASICFELNHAVGSLVDILMIMKCHELNMTKIQSVPVIGKPYQYHFHVDVMWDNHQYFINGMEIVRNNVSNLQILGEYMQGDKSGI